MVKVFHYISSLLICILYSAKGFQGSTIFSLFLLVLKVGTCLCPFPSVILHVPFCLLAFRKAIFFFLCLSIQWDPTGYCKIVNKGAWLGGCVNQSLQSWPCVRAYGSIPTVINASMNAASVTAGGAGACSQHSSSVSWAGTAGACSWEICELLRAFLKLVKCSSLPLSLTYFWRDWAVEEGWIFVFAFWSALGFPKDRSILADSGLAVMHLTCCLGLLVFEKEGAEASKLPQHCDWKLPSRREQQLRSWAVPLSADQLNSSQSFILPFSVIHITPTITALRSCIFLFV